MTNNKHYKKAEKYWSNLLSDYITLARFPNDYLKTEDTGFSIIQKTIKKSTYHKLLDYCEKSHVQIESVLDTVYGLVLQKFTYEDDVVFGKNSMLLPLRIKIDNPNMKFIDLAKTSMKQTEASMEYAYFMYSSEAYKSSMNDKLINTMFYFDVLKPSNFIDEKKLKLDLFMKASIKKGIRLKLFYKSCFYDKRTARSIVYLYKYILKQIVENEDIRLNEIQNMKDEHEELFTNLLDGNRFVFDVNISYLDKLKEQILKTPDNIAISDYEKDISYKDMDLITNRIANELISKGIKKGDTVAVIQDRNVNVVLSAISIIKIGAVFFPIDRTNPDERMTYLLEDGQSKIILTSDSFLDRIENAFPEYNYVCIDNIDNEQSTKQIDTIIRPEDEAYRISTSGTTGRPKCISIRHESLMNMCYFSIDYIKATEKDICGVYLSFSFDAIMKQIFPYLLIGARVDILPEYARENEFTVEEYCVKKSVTILALPSILGKLFMLSCPCPGLRVLQVGGDKFKGYVKRDYNIYNEYGPAEFTVLCTKFHVDQYYDLVPVGRPIYNTEAYIVDKNNNEVLKR